MDFGLSDEQRLLEDEVRRLLAETAPIARVREIAASESGFDAEVWKGLAEIGALGVLVPEEHGGSGLGFLDAVVIAESLGHAATPAPFLSSAILLPVALAEGGTEDLQREWLPSVAAGELRVGIAAAESYARREDAGVALEGDRLTGKALFALDAPGADLLLVAAGPQLCLVRADAPGVSIHVLSKIDRTRRIAEVLFEGAETAAVLAGGGETLDRVLDAGRIALAADALGAADRMIALAVEYAKQRKQFERVIGSFQAVKHMCAEMIAELEPARSMLWYAAHAFDSVPEEAALMAAQTKAHIAEIGTEIAKTATEVHGGVGFTDEQNLHFWFKRIGLDRQLFGGPELLRERAASLQGWV